MSDPTLAMHIAVARAIQVADNQYIPEGYAKALPKDITDWAAWVADAAIRTMLPMRKETDTAAEEKDASNAPQA